MAETQVTEVSSTTTQTTHETSPESRGSSLLSDILTIIGFAILFIIIIWGLVHLVELIASSFSANKPAATIQVSAPAQVTSGDPVTISWKYSPSVSGSYAFLYECQNGLSFKMKAATSSSTNSANEASLPCGAAYTAPTSNNSFTLTPVLTATSSTADTISIVFIPNKGSSEVQGNATMTVNQPVAMAPAKPVSAKPSSSRSYSSSSYSSSNYGTQYSGPAQLSVRVISGTINGDGDGTVTFDIANIGGTTSGSYYFTAQLPTAQPYPYQSPMQAPLAPGSHITSTLNFTDAQSGGGLFSVTIEGNNAIPPAGGSSDYASMEITGGYNNYGYSNNYNNSAPYVQYPTYTY